MLIFLQEGFTSVKPVFACIRYVDVSAIKPETVVTNRKLITRKLTEN